MVATRPLTDQRQWDDLHGPPILNEVTNVALGMPPMNDERLLPPFQIPLNSDDVRSYGHSKQDLQVVADTPKIETRAFKPGAKTDSAVDILLFFSFSSECLRQTKAADTPPPRSFLDEVRQLAWRGGRWIIDRGMLLLILAVTAFILADPIYRARRDILAVFSPFFSVTRFIASTLLSLLRIPLFLLSMISYAFTRTAGFFFQIIGTVLNFSIVHLILRIALRMCLAGYICIWMGEHVGAQLGAVAVLVVVCFNDAALDGRFILLILLIPCGFALSYLLRRFRRV